VANTGKTLTLSASLATTGDNVPTLAFGSAAANRTHTFPTTSATLARTDAAQSFTGTQTFEGTTISASGVIKAAGALFLRGDSSVTSAVILGTQAANMWVVQNTGHFVCNVDNTNDIGLSGALRPRSLFLAANITAGGTLAITGATALTGNLTANGAFISVPQASDGVGALSLATLTTAIATTGAAAATLAAGVNGQTKKLLMITDGGDCTVTVTNPSWVGGATGTATFNDVGDALVLEYVNAKWTPSSNIGVALA